MITSVIRSMVKKANIAMSHWNFCIQLIKSLKSCIFNLKLSFFEFFNHCPKNIC